MEVIEMRKAKRILTMAFCALLICNFAAYAGGKKEAGDVKSAGSQQAKYRWKIGSVDSTTNPNYIALQYLVEKLNQAAPGKWKIEIYPSSQLGDAPQMIESVQMGTLEITCPATAFVSSFVPEYGALDMPYLFRDTAHVDKVFDGEIGQKLAAMTDKANLKTVAFWEVGFRCLANAKRPIKSVDDVARLRLRIMKSDVHSNLFSALGCDPVPMSLSEAYVAIQNKTIDGMDNPLHSHVANHTNEVCKYFAVTNHVYSAMSLILSKKAWDSMPETDQKIFMDCVKDATAHQRLLAREQSKNAAEKLTKELNCEVTYPDLAGFEAKMAPVYNKYPQYADMIKSIKAVK